MAGDTDTIFACSSGRGAAGVAVIRVSGPAVGDILRDMVGGRGPDARMAVLRTIRHPRSGEALDRGLVIHMPAPASFTGEDCLEFHIHGGRAVVTAVLEALALVAGSRPAAAGEFTRRAFERGRLDLTAVEGLGELVAAETEAQRRLALKVSSGALETVYRALRGDILDARALLESQIDFSDEDDVAEIETEPVLALLDSAQQRISALLADAPAGRVIREGLLVVIAGAPNAGKSSLMNALSDREVAIVSQEAGTTRDVLEVRLDLAGQLVLLQDVAGIREGSGAVEAEGIARAREAVRVADLVIALSAPDAPFPEEALAERRAPVLHVWNKCDLEPFGPADRGMAWDLAISARTGEGVGAVVDRLSALAAEMCLAVDSVPIHMRHGKLLEAAALVLADGTDYLRHGEWDLAADCLRRAAGELDAILGISGIEDVLDAIFSRFCIGK